MKLSKLITFFIGLVFATMSYSAVAEIVVIVKADNPTNSLEKPELSRIYLGRAKTFPGGAKVVPVSQDSSSATKAEFEKALLGKSQSQMKAYWAKQSFSGRGSPPDEVGGDSGVLERVAADGEAIGYVDASAVNSSVKIVFRI